MKLGEGKKKKMIQKPVLKIQGKAEKDATEDGNQLMLNIAKLWNEHKCIIAYRSVCTCMNNLKRVLKIKKLFLIEIIIILIF